MPSLQSKPPSPHAGTPRSTARGCLIVAGVTALVIALVVSIVVGVLVWKARTLRARFSDTQLRTVPIAEASTDTAKRLSRTFDELQRAVEEGRSERFTFTDLQLNQMVSTVPAVREARGRAHFTIVDNHLKVDAGIPLDQIPGFQGRYLNGEFTWTCASRMASSAFGCWMLPSGASLCRRSSWSTCASRIWPSKPCRIPSSVNRSGV